MNHPEPSELSTGIGIALVLLCFAYILFFRRDKLAEAYAKSKLAASPSPDDTAPRCDFCGGEFRHPELVWRIKETGQIACNPDCLAELMNKRGI